ncbi:MAG: hypothetical protein ACI845_001234 [Gammaproteobacteria bacterium]|jgi:hypothetical protein
MESKTRMPGRSRLFCAWLKIMGLVSIVLFELSGSALRADEKLTILKRISASGAPDLTIRLLDQAQPQIDADLYGWIAWEQERLAILSNWQEWDQLLIRIEKLPDDLPDLFKEQIVSYKVQAYLKTGQPGPARDILRQQLWRVESAQLSQYQIWRRLIIQTYLQENRIDDARISMLRFNLDYDNNDQDWMMLQSEVLMRSERYEQVIQLLLEASDWQAEITSLLAQLRIGQLDHEDIRSRVSIVESAKDQDINKSITYRVLGYFASQGMSVVDQVVALEQIFHAEVSSPLNLFSVTAEELWRAYAEYGRLVGNRAELLVGDDQQWLELAKIVSEVTPAKSRSLCALLMLESSEPDIIEAAAQLYLETLDNDDPTNRNLLENLFNKSQAFADANRIPNPIRYQLVDVALKNADIEEATRLMSGLTSIPSGTTRFNWLLRQSRVLVLGGRYDEGQKVLETLISEYNEVTDVSTDRILQVLFDLQTVELNESAVQLFNFLLSKPINPRHRREILFWIADSYGGLEQYEQAALLYLQSAMLPGPDVMDPWAQTARYNAAESLKNAGLVDDARRIYEALLKITPEPARRSLLNHNIQRLWLNRVE